MQGPSVVQDERNTRCQFEVHLALIEGLFERAHVRVEGGHFRLAKTMKHVTVGLIVANLAKRTCRLVDGEHASARAQACIARSVHKWNGRAREKVEGLWRRLAKDVCNVHPVRKLCTTGLWTEGVVLDVGLGNAIEKLEARRVVHICTVCMERQ
eukprot:scaffold42615_cov37-Tisochrysis_lutea.AAC.1